MGHRTISNRKMEIKRPCLKDVISFPNLLAQNTQTAMVICTAKNWHATGVKEEKTFANYHCTLERKIVGFLCYSFVNCKANCFVEQKYLVKRPKDQGSPICYS